MYLSQVEPEADIKWPIQKKMKPAGKIKCPKRREKMDRDFEFRGRVLYLIFMKGCFESAISSVADKNLRCPAGCRMHSHKLRADSRRLIGTLQLS